MDIQTAEQVQKILDDAELRHRQFIDMYHWDFEHFHNEIINNPILQDMFVIEDVYKDFRYLDVK